LNIPRKRDLVRGAILTPFAAMMVGGMVMAVTGYIFGLAVADAMDVFDPPEHSGEGGRLKR